jgi:hypothetical protein
MRQVLLELPIFHYSEAMIRKWGTDFMFIVAMLAYITRVWGYVGGSIVRVVADSVSASDGACLSMYMVCNWCVYLVSGKQLHIAFRRYQVLYTPSRIFARCNICVRLTV